MDLVGSIFILEPATVLKNQGYEVEISDCVVEKKREAETQIPELKRRLVETQTRIDSLETTDPELDKINQEYAGNGPHSWLFPCRPTSSQHYFYSREGIGVD